MYLEYIAAGWLMVINLGAFAMFGIDKKRAKQRKYRIPERTLLLLAVLGGSVGAILGMRCFHHKTRHAKFKIGLPVILLAQLALAGWMIYGGNV